MTEQWRPIEGYEGLYEVSNLGKVRSLDRIDCTGRRLKGKILIPLMMKNGYLSVFLCKEGKAKHFLIHRLVAQAFILNPEGLKEINHKDEDKTNNLVDNLEYCDRKYNMNYGTRTERDVQTKIRKGLFDPEMCGIKDRKEYDRLYNQKNKERIRERNKEWYQENRDQILEQQRDYYQKNREQINERRREQYRRRKKKTKQTT